MEVDNKAMLAEELERMKIETEHEKAEIQMKVSHGHEYNRDESMKLEMAMVDLNAERSIITLQVNSIFTE